MTDVPADLEKIIQDILAHKKLLVENCEEESSLEYLYNYYPEYDEIEPDEADEKAWPTVIKIDL